MVVATYAQTKAIPTPPGISSLIAASATSFFTCESQRSVNVPAPSDGGTQRAKLAKLRAEGEVTLTVTSQMERDNSALIFVAGGSCRRLRRAPGSNHVQLMGDDSSELTFSFKKNSWARYTAIIAQNSLGPTPLLLSMSHSLNIFFASSSLAFNHSLSFTLNSPLSSRPSLEVSHFSKLS